MNTALKIDLSNTLPSDWNTFIASISHATLGHDTAWGEIFQETYAIKPIYLIARNNNQYAGVLSLTEFPTWRGKKELISLPFLDSAGILAINPQVEKSLLDKALEFMRERNASYLELRQSKPLENQVDTQGNHRVNMILNLESDEETQWKAFRDKVRNQTRKAMREKLRINSGVSEKLVSDFYTPFAVNMRDLGSPVHAKRFFSIMKDAFGDNIRFFVAYHQARPIGGLVAILHGKTVYVPWASTLYKARKLCPNNLLYWEAIRWAIINEATQFDFGRSPRNSGTYKFKQGFGAKEYPLAWMRFDSKGHVKQLNNSDDSHFLQNMSKLWRFLPLSITTFLGPKVRRYFSN